MNIDMNALLLQLIIQAPPLLFALTMHELAHGYIAYRLGDPTAKEAGRLTMNPLKHLDPLGVIAFIIMKIGWAKPVPVDPRYFRNPRKDMLTVALAGPAANVLLAIASAVLVQFLVRFQFLPFAVLQPLAHMLVASVWINLMLAVFSRHFEVPTLPTDVDVFALALELSDRVYARSVHQHGLITPRMAEEGMRVFDAYVGLYLPAYLPKR